MRDTAEVGGLIETSAQTLRREARQAARDLKDSLVSISDTTSRMIDTLLLLLAGAERERDEALEEVKRLSLLVEMLERES